MGTDFGSAEGLLGSTMSHLKRMTETESGRNYLFLTFLFTLIILFVLWMLF